MRVLLVENYAPDAQQSMLRFGELLARVLPEHGCAVERISPAPNLLRLAGARAQGRWGKWIAYLDKYAVFSNVLSRRLAQFASGSGPAVMHIVDHGNAVYVPRRAPVPVIVTCHDLLAVRGALGEQTGCPATMLGRQLQRAIVAGLGRADAVACDSTSTWRDAERLVAKRKGQRRPVILVGLNHAYRPIAPAEARARLACYAEFPWDKPFLLHVGSNSPRKNKVGVLRVFQAISAEWPGTLVFAGAELPREIGGGGGRVRALPHPSNEELEALYSLAQAMVFPSTCEGFGWPVIEAQACGCPVICSDRTSLPEVGGEAALVFDVDDTAGMARAVRQLEEPGFRARVVERGRANLARFTPEGMAKAYVKLYHEAQHPVPMP